ncbi:Carotenoid oxygenase [Botryosphaeria dothidea]|uniref:Carotenoid oxygenase n=1 Tax=Botryosphaeria dothidea TaxID=55169 RepID=A0A8H4MZT3_9PEZI|nr:Carotenoid oxygenase [Botryosphaeria dothidea]
MVRKLNYDDFSGATRPFRADAELDDLEVEGEIPPELNGTFYRQCYAGNTSPARDRLPGLHSPAGQVMHDPYYPRDYYKAGSKTIPFDGDGSISAFRIKDGKCAFKQRYVLTERFLAERRAGRAMFGILKTPFSHHPCVRAVQDNTANTNVIVHAGKLLALSEQGPPYELDPKICGGGLTTGGPADTMTTLGNTPFPGQIPKGAPFTAHPHVDPKTGDLVGYGYGLKGVESKDCTVWVLDKNGKRTFERTLTMPGNGFVHDCAITDNYVVLEQMPFVADASNVEKPGGHMWTYDASVPAWFGLVPRKDPDQAVRWFKWKNAMPVHTGGSFEEDGKVFFDTSIAIGNAFPFLPTKKERSGESGQAVTVNYVRFKIDPQAETDQLDDPEVLVDVPCEFPRTDERFLTRRPRYTFMDCFDPTAVADPALLYRGLNCLARYDDETKKLEVMSPGQGVLVQEPCFSARGPKAAEGDGFLITLVDNMPLGRNEIIIQDTRDFQQVVARVILPFRAEIPAVFVCSEGSDGERGTDIKADGLPDCVVGLRSAVHGNWVDAERIPETGPFIEPLPDMGRLYPAN